MRNFKRIIGTILACGIALSSVNVFAVDENEIMTYLDSVYVKYPTEENVRAAKEGILGILIENYECSNEEAETYFEEFVSASYVTKKDEEEDNTDSEQPEVKQEEITTVSEETVNNFKVLCDLGLINNVEGTFDFEANTTRGELARIISAIMTYKKGSNPAELPYMFLDIEEESNEYEFIAECIKNGVVEGYGDGYFRPENEITLDETLRMVLRAMGYSKKVELMGGSYYTIANEISLLKSVSHGLNDVISNADYVNIIYQALLSEVFTSVAGTNGLSYTKGDSMLKTYMDIMWQDTLVTANERTSLITKSDAVALNTIQAGDKLYSFTEGYKPDVYLGQNVRIFYPADDSTTGISIRPDTRKNEWLTVNCTEIDEYKDGILYYSDDDKSDRVKMGKNIHIIFNGTAVEESFDENIFTPQIGEIKFISNDSDTDYEIAFISSYIPYMNNNTGSVNPVISDEFRIQDSLEIDDDKFTFIKNDTECLYSDLSGDAVLLVAPDAVKFVKEDGLYYITPDTKKASHYTVIEMTQEVVGKVESVRSDEMVKVNGVEYEFSGYFNAMNTIFADNDYFKCPTVNANVKLLTDMYNNIIAVEITGYSTDLKYAWLKKTVWDDDGEKPLLKLFTQDDEHVVLEVADKIRVHYKWEESSSLINEDTYYGKRIDSTELLSRMGGSLENQLIRYSQNSDGLVDRVYVAESDYLSTEAGKDLKFKRDGDVLSKYWAGTYEKGFFFAKDYAKLYFIIPNDMGYEEAFDVSPTNITADTQNEFYNADEAGSAEIVVQRIDKMSKTGEEATGVWTAFPAVVAKDVDQCMYWDEQKEEVVYNIQLFHYKRINKARTDVGVYTYKVPVDGMTTYIYITAGYDKYSEVPISELKAGDIIYTDISTDGTEILYAGLISRNTGERVSDGKPECGSRMNVWYKDRTQASAYTGSRFGSRQTICRGYVKEKIDGTIYIDDNTGYLRRLGVNSVVVYDKTKGTIEAGAVGDIRRGDYVVGFTNQSYGSGIIYVVRNY